MQTEFIMVRNNLELKVDEAIQDILILLNPSTDGYDDMGTTYIDALHSYLVELTKIKRGLWKKHLEHCFWCCLQILKIGL